MINRKEFCEVFSYGSNMLTARLRDRVPGAVPIAAGFVRGRSLKFNKIGRDGSAKANAVKVESDESCVWGVVFSVPVLEKPTLDRCESLGVGYDEVTVPVGVGRNGGQSEYIRATLYVARPAMVQDELRPFTWYHQLCVRGAEQHRLPADYVRRLRQVVTREDFDSKRRGQHEKLLAK